MNKCNLEPLSFSHSPRNVTQCSGLLQETPAFDTCPINIKIGVMGKSITLTVDSIIVTDGEKVVLVKRRFDPYKNYWALPGGIVEYGETVEAAVVREAKEETGLDIRIDRLVGVYSDPKRDPRGHFVSVCFLCKPIGGEPRSSDETKEVKLFSKEELKGVRLAFDHETMLRDAGFTD